MGDEGFCQFFQICFDYIIILCIFNNICFSNLFLFCLICWLVIEGDLVGNVVVECFDGSFGYFVK